MLRRVSAIIVLIVIMMLLASAALAAPRTRASTAHYLEPWPCMQPYQIYEKACMGELYQIAMYHLNRQMYDKAIMRFSQILTMQEFSLVYSNRGAAHFFKRDFTRARPDMARAIDLDPRRAEHWYNLARVDFELKRYEEALDSANVAVDLDPNRADFLDLRAGINTAMHRTHHAQADTKRALEIREADEKKVLSERALSTKQR